MGLTGYAEKILNIYNYFDGVIVTDRNGIVEYYYNSRKDINTLSDSEILGKSLFEVYPGVSRQSSSSSFCFMVCMNFVGYNLSANTDSSRRVSHKSTM